MIKRSAKYYLLQGIVVSLVALLCLISYAVTVSMEKSEEDTLKYVSYEVLTDNVMPTLSEQEQSTIIRPYNESDVEIGKNYYDINSEESKQENSIIYYENTYIQNTGTDYKSKKVFDIIAISDGKVLSVTTDDIVGTTVKIEHNNNLISVYQSINDVQVKENDTVAQGQVIAKSGTNNISSDLGNHLHFELYKENVLIDPEEYFNQSQGN